MGCCGSKDNSAAKKSDLKTNWNKIKAQLPRLKTPEQLKERDELYRKFDPNNNGYLSYAEVERGCKQHLQLHEFIPEAQLQPVLVRAFNTAKSARVAKGEAADDKNTFVERVEFRLLLVYIYDYFELYVAFDELDSSDDKKVSLDEFKKAVPQLESWGVKVEDPEATFKQIDAGGEGTINFQEFADWALKQHLDVDGEENIH